MRTETFKKTLFLIIPLIIALSVILPTIRSVIGKGEFVQYWSSARLLITGENPYNQVSLKALEEKTLPEVDFNQGLGLPVFNPPWMMLVMMPLGFLSFDLATRVWIIINILIIGFTTQILWTEFFNPINSKGYALVLVSNFFFFETLNLIFIGQITGLVLIALILALLCLSSGKDIAAGSLLIIVTIKPHLTYLVLMLVVVWIIRYRRWKVFYGMVGTTLLSVIIISVILPNWYLSYSNLLRSFPIQRFVTTTLGGFINIEFGINYFRFAGLLLLPLIFPLVNLIEREDWLPAINIALLISLPLSPYGFSFDEILLLPAIAQMIFWVSRKELSHLPSIIIISGTLIIYLLRYSLLLVYEIIPYHFLIWQPLALCLLYLYAWKAKGMHYRKISHTVY